MPPTLQQTLWQQTVKRLLWGKQSVLYLVGLHTWYALTELPLLWAARQELATALAELDQDHAKLSQRMLTGQHLPKSQQHHI
jgi:hypothetical protein